MRRKLPQIAKVRCDQVRTGRNYRKFSREELEDLLESIKTRGILQNPIVTSNRFQDREEKPYEIVAGERRFRCCEILGRDFEALYYPELAEDEFTEIQLAENVKKEINVGETAISTFDFYKDLIAEKLGINPSKLEKFNHSDLPEEYKRVLPLKDFAVIRGRSESIIRDYFSFAGMNPMIRSLVTSGNLDYQKAVMISKFPEDMQEGLAMNFRGNVKNLQSILRNLKESSRDLVLEPLEEKRPKERDLEYYVSNLARTVDAGVEYFKRTPKKCFGELNEIVSSALDYLTKLQNYFEDKANKEGKLQKVKNLAMGKEYHKNQILNLHFNGVSEGVQDLEGRLLWLDPNLIHPDSNQPRKTFETDALKELQRSIESIGQQQPGMVCLREDGEYDLIFGERRWRAISANNLERKSRGIEPDKYLAKVVTGLSSAMKRILQYDEDFHQEDRPDERAEAIYKWQRRRLGNNEKINTSEISKKMGIGKKAVRRALDYAAASRDLKALYKKKLISYESAAELSSIPKELQKEFGFRLYLHGGGINFARKLVQEFELEKNQLELFPPSEIRSGFEQAIIGDLSLYLDPRALKRLENANIYSPSFVPKFYSLIRELKTLSRYFQTKSLDN